MPKNPDVRITTTVVAYTSFCDGQVTRFSSLRTSERKSRIRSKRPPAASLTVSNRPASSAIHQFTNSPIPPFTNLTWQARRESNPQPPVLETGALPIELLAYNSIGESVSWRIGECQFTNSPIHQFTNYF